MSDPAPLTKEESYVCADCKNVFFQAPRCTTCGAEKLYDATVRSQAAEIEQLRKDAARYRWLRDRGPMADVTIECFNSSLAGGVCHLSHEDADEAIDAAMEQQS